MCRVGPLKVYTANYVLHIQGTLAQIMRESHRRQRQHRLMRDDIGRQEGLARDVQQGYLARRVARHMQVFQNVCRWYPGWSLAHSILQRGHIAFIALC